MQNFAFLREVSRRCFSLLHFLLQKANLYIKMDQKDREFRLKKGNITLNSFLVVLTTPRLISCTKRQKKDGPFSTDVLQLEG